MNSAMKTDNLILKLSCEFALLVMSVAKTLRVRKEHELASQLWRAGTSIGANVEEAQAAQSRSDFKSKMSIAAKEARETRYWIRLAHDAGLLPPGQCEDLLGKIESILRILTSIVLSTSQK